jgi:hypothetical protein
MAKLVELHPTEEELQYWRGQISNHCVSILGLSSQEEIDKRTQDIINRAISGWSRAPKTFSARIRKLTKDWGTNGENKENLKPVQDQLSGKIGKDDQSLRRKESELNTFMELYEGFANQLPVHDKTYFDRRVRYYLTEFNFNMSSDLPLVLELITEELLHRRVMAQMATQHEDFTESLEASAIYSKVLRNITENMSNIQKTLGITRQQRQTALGGTEGSVSEISMKLEEKKKSIEKIRAEEKKQEETLMRAKIERGDINQLPEDPDMLKALINAGEEIEVEK